MQIGLGEKRDALFLPGPVRRQVGIQPLDKRRHVIAAGLVPAREQDQRQVLRVTRGEAHLIASRPHRHVQFSQAVGISSAHGTHGLQILALVQAGHRAQVFLHAMQLRHDGRQGQTQLGGQRIAQNQRGFQAGMTGALHVRVASLGSESS